VGEIILGPKALGRQTPEGAALGEDILPKLHGRTRVRIDAGQTDDGNGRAHVTSVRRGIGSSFIVMGASLIMGHFNTCAAMGAGVPTPDGVVAGTRCIRSRPAPM